MAKHEKRFSVNSLEKLMPKEQTVAVALENGETLTVKRRIGLNDMLGFVAEVCQVCFDGETGDYLPEAMEFAIRQNLVRRYALCNLPENVGKQYDLLYQTGIYEAVLNVVDRCQFDAICQAAERKIAHMLQGAYSAERRELMQVSRQMEEIAASTAKLFEGLDMNTVMQAMKQMQGMDEEKLVEAISSRLPNEPEPSEGGPAKA